MDLAREVYLRLLNPPVQEFPAPCRHCKYCGRTPCWIHPLSKPLSNLFLGEAGLCQKSGEGGVREGGVAQICRKLRAKFARNWRQFVSYIRGRVRKIVANLSRIWKSISNNFMQIPLFQCPLLRVSDFRGRETTLTVTNGLPQSTVEQPPHSNESSERECPWSHTISTVPWVHRKLKVGHSTLKPLTSQKQWGYLCPFPHTNTIHCSCYWQPRPPYNGFLFWPCASRQLKGGQSGLNAAWFLATRRRPHSFEDFFQQTPFVPTLFCETAASQKEPWSGVAVSVDQDLRSGRSTVGRCAGPK